MCFTAYGNKINNGGYSQETTSNHKFHSRIFFGAFCSCFGMAVVLFKLKIFLCFQKC